MDEYEIIELGSPWVRGEGQGRVGGSPVDEERSQSRRSVAQRRWKDAIHQQVLLLRMEKENQWLKGEWVGVCALCR